VAHLADACNHDLSSAFLFRLCLQARCCPPSLGALESRRVRRC
jgi:hypothetical protein